MFKGSMVALVTPMLVDGSIDKESLLTLLDWHIAANTQAIILAGTTGESATLTSSEKKLLLEIAIKHVAGKIPIIAGSGTNSTATTIEESLNAQKAGAAACLIVTPYYNKPTQTGLLAHYRAVSNAISIPIILYNVPGRTACDLLPETVGLLSQEKNIIGIKDATGDIARVHSIASLSQPGFNIYSGDDLSALDLMLAGGQGVISVTSNVAPHLMQQMCEAALKKDVTTANAINQTLIPLHKNLFIESNPIPVKWILNKMGLIPEGIRLPLTPLSHTHENLLNETIRESNIKSFTPQHTGLIS